MKTEIKNLADILVEGEAAPKGPWHLRVVKSDQCLSYLAWNEKTKEALLVDPKDTDLEAYRSLAKELAGYTWLGVIDSHTHADHISIAYDLANELGVSLMTHHLSPSSRVHLRVSKDCTFQTHSGPLKFLLTPGHTQDAMVILWGPYVFGGDTLLFGDTGRDDLPGGSASDHYESLQKIKKNVTPEMILLPGHDHKGGRASSWGTQLKLNSSLTQNREDFVREAEAFEAPAPEFFKKSLKENSK